MIDRPKDSQQHNHKLTEEAVGFYFVENDVEFRKKGYSANVIHIFRGMWFIFLSEPKNCDVTHHAGRETSGGEHRAWIHQSAQRSSNMKVKHWEAKGTRLKFYNWLSRHKSFNLIENKLLSVTSSSWFKRDKWCWMCERPEVESPWKWVHENDVRVNQNTSATNDE